MLRYYDVNFNVGGPIKKDKAWWHFSWRRQFNAVEQPLFTFDQSFDTWNQNPSAKVTYQLNQKNKIIGYYQWNMKEQPNRLPIGGYTYTDPTQTSRQVSPSWVYKAEWNGTRQRSSLPRSALGRLRLLRSALLEQRRRLLLARHHAAGADRRARRDRRPIAIASS